MLGFATLSRGHTVLFWLGIIFPILWFGGALMEPTSSAAAGSARNTPQQP